MVDFVSGQLGIAKGHPKFFCLFFKRERKRKKRAMISPAPDLKLCALSPDRETDRQTEKRLKQRDTDTERDRRQRQRQTALSKWEDKL